MTIIADSGPLVTFGPDFPANSNPEAGPCLFYQGMGILDPRTAYTYYPGQNFGAPMYGFCAGTYLLCDQVPSTIATANIAALQSPGAGAIVLVSTSGAGITAGVTINRADTNTPVTGLLAIDGVMSGVAFGQAGTVKLWDPTKAVSRAVQISSGGNDTGITFTVNGFDVYGFPMSENITGASGAAASGKKAFKYISSITHTGSIAAAVSVGTTDIYGFGLAADTLIYTDIVWNNLFSTTVTVPFSSGSGYVFADTTSPATKTTGDVRGTINIGTAVPSNNSRRLQIFITPSVARLSQGTTGLFGVTQA
jgi:hypothetical protein